ncbi:MAG TPA: DUF5698 domain-containing protein [Phycisphaerae bacterium]|nr:DUF5698 domain-containing protein [Phycisphaerae bacterium]
MTGETVFVCLMIILARIADVSLGTVRTISVVNGRATLASIVGFFEILIWIFAVSRVIQNLSDPAYAVSYAIGFALGNLIGIKIDQRIAFGEQVVRIFSSKGEGVAASLRHAGFTLTEFQGSGRDGFVTLLFVQVPRRDVSRALHCAAVADPKCFYLVDDIRMAAHPPAEKQAPTGWRSIVKKE